MPTPRYSYQAINQLALSDTGHFVFLDSWSISLLLSMLSQNMPLWYWANEQHPLSEAEINDLDHKLAKAGGQLMQTMVGLIMPVCTAVVPEGTLLCDGSSHARIDYPNLYDSLDPVYHIDVDMFTVPDMRDRFIVGSGTTKPVNLAGGSFEHTQSIGEMPIHTHGNDPHQHSEVTATPIVVTIGLELPTASAIPGIGATGLSSVNIHNAGGGEPMDITPPFISLRYVVVAL